MNVLTQRKKILKRQKKQLFGALMKDALDHLNGKGEKNDDGERSDQASRTCEK